jgi:hypothetical protein
MSGDERVRYCRLCKLSVYNFSAMRGDEIRELVAGSSGRICGKLYKRADGTILTKDCPVGFRAYQKRVTRLAGATLAAVLGLFSVSFGQKENKVSIDASKVRIVKQATPQQKSLLSGRVMDETGALVPGAEIRLTGKNRIDFKVNSSDEGIYLISPLAAGVYKLKIKAPGFKEFEVKNLEIKEDEKNELDIHLSVIGEVMVGVVGISEEPLIDVTSSGVTTTITRRTIDRLPR